MKLGRNQLCPCGSGVKFKKCCRIAAVVIDNAGLAVPAYVVDDVVNTISKMSDEDFDNRLDDLARTQPHLCAFITPLSNALPQEASFPAALAAFAIIWMFEQHHQRHLPQVTPAQIQRCLDNNGRSFFDFEDFRDRRGSMSGKAQPSIHKFIADTILDFDDNDYGSDAFDLFNLFMMLKTTVNALHDATSRPIVEKPVIALSAAAH
jgi:SEC-C motif-containing protein